MDKNKILGNRLSLWILRIVLSLILFAILIYLSSPACPDYCHQLPSILGLSLLAIAFVIFLVIAVVLKSPPAFSILVVVLVLTIFYLGAVCPRPDLGELAFNTTHRWTTAGYNLHAGSSQLELKFDLESSSFLSQYFRINGIKCIKANRWSMQEGWVSSAPAFIEPLNESMKNCTRTWGANWGTFQECTYMLYCTNEDGSIPADTSPGTGGCFNIYMNYTNLTSGETYIATARMSARYW